MTLISLFYVESHLKEEKIEHQKSVCVCGGGGGED